MSRKVLPKGAGGVRCLDCDARAAADGKGSPIILRHAEDCPTKVRVEERREPFIQMLDDNGEVTEECEAWFEMAECDGCDRLRSCVTWTTASGMSYAVCIRWCLPREEYARLVRP